ncbi:Uu.00g028830.m01.CDS01 [Anthostomella pinea]|uniref:Uu.00g028830.m01.CDS01 n=1 Tax=Anthostomella pinea TaxID=933095 RepID=A0AAI8V808_9PEZI|nr:Uu.00g028830.m01.CDS01 [Anthostomella pinea]
MHPAPSLAESFPKNSKPEERAQHHVSRQHDQDIQQRQPPQQAAQVGHPHSMTPESHHSVPASLASPPIRKGTASSTSTTGSDATVITNASIDTDSTAYSAESSQSIFSIKDGTEISGHRRASRRRTGPLSAQQREKAALIRKLGACGDCRRRRVACHPNHHDMSWEDAVRKYRSSSPLQDLAPLADRHLSPAPSHIRAPFAQDPQEMDIDTSPTTPNAQTTLSRPPLGDARVRTPLPSGPRLDKPIPMAPLISTSAAFTPIQNLDSIKADLNSTASRILSSPHRSRYTTVYVLLIYWQDDDDPGVSSAVDELAEVFDKYYHYTLEVSKIPPNASSGCANSWRWLSRIINDFTDHSDTRDVLKIVYYNGYSFLDENREMVLASSQDRDEASTIRWSGIQQILEEACSDTLIIMDAAYYPSTSKMVRQKGVLELIAASTSEDYFAIFDRGCFTRTLADQLRTRAVQRPPPNASALSAAELHAKLLSIYPKLVHDRHPHPQKAAAAVIPNLPSPLHMQMSGNARLPSITLSPRTGLTRDDTEIGHGGGPQLTLSIRLTDDALSLENWTEWFRMMPEGIRAVKVEGPSYLSYV